MIDPHFAILGALIATIGNAAYAWDTYRGRTQPNRVSWALWALAPLIAFAAELGQSIGVEAILTFSVGFGPLLVFVASFHDDASYGQLTRLDVLCAAFSVLAMIGWAVTGTGDVAIALSVLADLLGAFPTYSKAYRAPQTESANAFACGAIGSAVALLAISPGHWSLATAAFPTYIVCSGTVVTALILRPRRKAPTTGS